MLRIGERLPASLPPGVTLNWRIRGLRTHHTYGFTLALRSPALASEERFKVRFQGPPGAAIQKELHGGDPSLYFQYRSEKNGDATIELSGNASRPIPLLVSTQLLSSNPMEASFLEAEPNDSPESANPLVLGHTIYGTADDIEWLNNESEGQNGLDWFVLDHAGAQPILAFFEIDLIDRDVSVNLNLFRQQRGGKLELYYRGKDPMEVIHDRQKVRYSKMITRVLEPGRYYLKITGNHPFYILRSKTYPVPPITDPGLAIEMASRYLVDIGDAWLAQVPRNGDRFRRSETMHDTIVRCTACHPTAFPTEAALEAHRYGYPIQAKSQFHYLIERIYNGPTPLYGYSDVYWQRYIGIPLQMEGKQGGIIADFEREISRHPSPAFLRFAPYLKHAWKNRNSLPKDEGNGVIPLDSKFGFAVRDWRVLMEYYRRTRDPEALDVANRIRQMVTGQEALGRLENMQDRAHRLWGLGIMGQEYQQQIRREAEEIFSMQNPDDGWPDQIVTVVSTGKESAEYLTGQIIWTMIQAGIRPEKEPRLEKAARWLLGKQQDFGGWFQTGTTGENFQTPQRETRYAVMALAAAYPRATAGRKGWGNRSGGTARAPRIGTVVESLEDLDDLWEVADEDRDSLTRMILPLTDPNHPALARTLAAAALGRVGNAASAGAVASMLDAPEKMVAETAAWALRQFGNRGIGLEHIRGVLRSTNPLVRRGAARIFAYQFYGMDDRLEFVDDYLQFLTDPDLPTRLQAVRTLEQWWYRTSDATARRRITQAFIDRLDVRDEDPVLRINLSKGLYILLDENLGGGVALQKWTDYLSLQEKEFVHGARAIVERDLLLRPVFTALQKGSSYQSEGLLAAFDGTPWRQYARPASTDVDIGNDREFSFFHQASAEEITPVFLRILKTPLSAAALRQALELSHFFRLPKENTSTELQDLYLRALKVPYANIPEIARSIVGDALVLRASEDNSRIIGAITRLLDDTTFETREAILRLLSRNTSFLSNQDVRDRVRSTALSSSYWRAALSAVPTNAFTDLEALQILRRGWTMKVEERARLSILEALAQRKMQMEDGPVFAEVIDLVKLASSDPSPIIRERAVAYLATEQSLARSEAAIPIIEQTMSDAIPGVRLLAVRMAGENETFWQRPDTLNSFLPRIIDGERGVRAAALTILEKRGLLQKEECTSGGGPLARHIQALLEDEDPKIQGRARNLLQLAGLKSAAIQPDVRLPAPSPLDYEFFRERVNRAFYNPALDGNACVNCHVTHELLRIAPAPSGGKPLTDAEIRSNYESALRVIDLNDRENSLILRKPRSPYGQGNPDPASPTGLTHGGGTRWFTFDDGGYRAMLQWIRGARLGDNK